MKEAGQTDKKINCIMVESMLKCRIKFALKWEAAESDALDDITSQRQHMESQGKCTSSLDLAECSGYFADAEDNVELAEEMDEVEDTIPLWQNLYFSLKSKNYDTINNNFAVKTQNMEENQEEIMFDELKFENEEIMLTPELFDHDLKLFIPLEVKEDILEFAVRTELDGLLGENPNQEEERVQQPITHRAETLHPINIKNDEHEDTNEQGKQILIISGPNIF